jgi:hypothetical protein
MNQREVRMREALALVAIVAGCAADAPSRGRVAVEMSSREPERDCAWLGVLEVRAPPRARTAQEMLGAWAAERGGNYVVVDAFSVRAEPETEVVARARLYACPRP